MFSKASIQSKQLTQSMTSTLEESLQIDDKVLIITPKAMAHISDLKAKQVNKNYLRMGVRATNVKYDKRH
jgi:uncharacterized protein (UPF0371 family)